MIDYTYADLFAEGSTDKQMSLAFDGGETITNEDIYSESMSIKESICSEEQLTFGRCEASEFKITIANSFVSHVGQRVTVSAILDGNEDEPFVYGTYIVTSDTPTADHLHREITAYDNMYTIINADVADWYNGLLPDEDSTVTLKEFRDSFFAYFDIEQEDAELANDDMTVEKTISPSTLSGRTVINSICEINGCFGHIGRDGKFKYIILGQVSESTCALAGIVQAGFALAGVGDEGNVAEITSSDYISCVYEDFETPYIDALQIRQEEDDAGYTYAVGENDNVYVIEDNFLVYGKSTDELKEIAINLYNIISDISYRPAEVSAIGNPCLEVGDGILLDTTYQEVRTYILQRTLKGPQALRDTYTADGAETYSEDLNSLSNEIVQLKGKTNTLTKTVEETIAQITDIEEGLENTIKQTAAETLATIAGTSNTWDDSGYEDALTLYGTPDDAGYDAADYTDQYYIDQNTGYVYQSDGETWSKVAELDAMTSSIKTLISESISSSAASITSSITSSYEKYVADALESYSTTTVMENYITQTVGDSENSIKEYVAENYTTSDDVEKAVSASLVLEIITDEETGEKYGVLSANADCIKLTGSDIEIETDDLTLADGSATFSGSLEAASGTFKGTLEAVDGTFTGTLSGVDGTFEGELVAANGTFGTITGGILMSSNYVEDESGIYIDLNNGTINCASLTASISDGLLLKVSETYATLEDYDTLEALIDDSVASVVAYYAISDSGTDYPEQSTASGGSALAGEAYADVALAGDADWTEDMPEYEDGDYVWMCHLITYVSGETKWTVPSLIVDGSLSTRVATLKETTASIQVLTDSIMQAVTTTSSTWYTGDYVVSVTSCGTPDDEGIEASYYSGSYYLDQETGYLYYSDGSSWSKAAELTSTTEKLQSLIESTESSILLSVSQEYALNATAVYYGTCDNISAYPAKTIECDNFTEDSLTAGATIYVTFVNGCTCYSGYSISLIINGTGAVATYINGEALTESNCPECNAGETIAFIYDGEHWNVQLSETAIQASLALEILTDSNGKKYGALSANADYIKFTAGEFVVEANNFSIDENGDGAIGSWVIGETALYNGTESIDSWNAGAYVGMDGIRYVAADGNDYSFVQLDEDGITLYDNRGYVSTSGSHHYVASFSKSAVSIGFHTVNDDADFGGGGFLIGCEADGSYPKFTAYGSNACERLVIYPGVTTSGASDGYIETDLSTTINNDLTVAGGFSVECTGSGDEPLTSTLEVNSGWVYVGDGNTTKPVLAGMNGTLSIGSITTGAWTAFSVTFDSGGFSDVPNVILTVRHYSAAAHYVKLGTVSTTGFTGYYYASNGTSIVIHWLALGL